MTPRGLFYRELLKLLHFLNAMTFPAIPVRLKYEEL